jgi:peptidoglycan/LPS O-acetylase OafA/YrhL
MHSPSLNYRPDIDGLRAVAVLAVVVHHVSESLMPGGFVGVDVFFVISGYLITTILLREMAAGQFTFRSFYERRARRIFPALFAVLAAALVASYFIFLPTDLVATARAALGTLAFASNIVFWRSRENYFDETDSKLNPLLHTWSLAVEEQFYLLFPIFLLIGFRYFRKWLFGALAAGAVVSLVIAAVMVRVNVSAVFFLLPFRAWELAAGALLAFGVVPPARNRAWREALAGLGLAAIFVSGVLYRPTTLFPGLAALAPVVGAAAIIHAGAGGSTLTARLLTWRPVVYVGLISYSLYLWHWPLIVFVTYLNGMEPPGPGLMIALVVSSLLLASASYHWIERPFRLGDKGGRRWALPATAAFAAAAAAASIGGLMTAGFAGRFDSQVLSLDKARLPVVPYSECSDLLPADGCLLGDARRAPDILLWGDSHLTAWAPALHTSLQKSGRTALVASTTACPPFVGMAGNKIKPVCIERNQDVQQYLLDNPQIKTVVLAAFWQTYFRNDGPLLVAAESGRALNGMAAAQSALASTRQWLTAQKRKVIVIGPTPVYEKDIPAALALEALTGRHKLDLSEGTQRKKHAQVLAMLQSFEPDPLVDVLDPIDWLCNPDCQVIDGGKPLYRDGHHLSVAGAQKLTHALSSGLALGRVDADVSH